jgi:hypothetical protein
MSTCPGDVRWLFNPFKNEKPRSSFRCGFRQGAYGYRIGIRPMSTERGII